MQEFQLLILVVNEALKTEKITFVRFQQIITILEIQTNRGE